MKIFRNKKGYTEAELMMVFALVALFGILCFTLIQAGSGAYERLAENRSNKAFARVALSYVENRVRQGDEGESIRVADSPLEGGGSALVISGITGVVDEELWILKKDNELVEYYVKKRVDIDPDSYFPIADVDSFEVVKTGKTLMLKIGYIINGEKLYQSRIIVIRSGGGAGYE